MKNRRNIIFIAIVIVFAGAILHKAFWSKRSQAVASGLPRVALPVEMLVAKPESLTETLNVIGTIEANESVVLRSEISGQITGIFFKEGQRVKKGALLVKIFDKDLQAGLAKAKANLKLAEDDEPRLRRLMESEAISKREYEVAFANLQSAKADVALLEAQISKTEIRAPFEGTIGFRQVSPGGYIASGTDIASLVDDNSAKIQFTVPEKYAQLVENNMLIKFRLEGQPEEQTAKIYAVAPYIDPATRTLQLKALAPNPNKTLLPGAFARISVVLKTKPEVVLIPTEAILSESAGQKVYLYKDGKVQPVMVETGMRTHNRAEIVQGIMAGDTVITSGMMQITPRTTVTPAKIN